MSAKKTFQAVLFGAAFGFLLQKGGVANYHVLEGQLLLRDFTVIKIMLSAALTGMILIRMLQAAAGLKLQIKPAQLGANVVGGFVFGAGFAFAGYCPGTGAAALGQGDAAALIPMAGLVAGSYAYAEASRFLARTVQTWGDRGEIDLPTALGLSPRRFFAAFAVLIAVVLVGLDRLAP